MKHSAAALLLTAALSTSLLAQSRDAEAKKAPPPAEEAIVLSPFLITSDRDRGYAATTSLGASRVALAVTDIPVSVVSLNEQFFADRGAIDAMEVLPFVSGVQRAADAAPGQEQFTLRGFAITGINIRDGLPERVAASDQPFDDAAVYERIEVIKGPAGTLYGTTSMGGVVNKISKWPRYTNETKVELQAQSYDKFVHGLLDSTGPLNDRTAYRVVLSSRLGDRYYDEDDAPNDFTNTLVAFTHKLGAEPGGAGRVWGRFQYLRFELDREQGVQFPTGFLDPRNPTRAPVLSDALFPVAKDANVLPEDDISRGNIYSYEAGYERSSNGPFGGTWTMRLVGRFSEGKGHKAPSYAQVVPVPIDAAGRIVQYTNAAGVLTNGDARFIRADDPRVADWRSTLSVREFAGFNKNSGAFLDIVGDFSTGTLHHTLVLTGQLTNSESEQAFFFWAVPNPSNTSALANSFSVLHPDYSGYSLANVKATAPLNFNPFNGHSDADGFAGGFQDNISILDNRLIAVVGARYDNVRSTTYTFNAAQSIAQKMFVADPSTTRNVTNQEWTFKYGLVGKPLRGLSVFGQIGETYIPVNSLGANGAKNPNQEGEIRELGVKVDLLGTRLVATASVFEMELTNVLVSVPNPPELGGGLVSVPAGKQTTDGFEIDLAYEPVPGLNLSVGYSDLTSKNEVGRSFRAVPIDAAWSALAKYGFRNGRWKGLFVGGSWKHNGTAAGDANNTFFVDQSNVFDGFIGYGRGGWSAQLNVFNLTDTDDPVTSVGDNAVFRALDRSYRLTLRYRF